MNLLWVVVIVLAAGAAGGFVNVFGNGSFRLSPSSMDAVSTKMTQPKGASRTCT